LNVGSFFAIRCLLIHDAFPLLKKFSKIIAFQTIRDFDAWAVIRVMNLGRVRHFLVFGALYGPRNYGVGRDLFAYYCFLEFKVRKQGQ